jgi:ATP-binding protein involved in chromosome partitioning
MLDADIYGPSQPRMLGMPASPSRATARPSKPIAHGIQAMSIGFLIEEDTPMIWRGPMVTQALSSCSRDQLARPRLSDHRHAARAPATSS